MPQAFIMKQVYRISHKQRSITSNAVFSVFFLNVNYLDKHVLSLARSSAAA